MKGWLDNYNDSKVSVPEGFVGMGNDTKGRNYSPAWGGQFEEGGMIAQEGDKLEKFKKWFSELMERDLSGNPIDPKSHEPYRAGWKEPINLTWGQAADSLQKKLNNPGGALLKAIDPTGTFSYGDVKNAWQDNKFTTDDVIEPLGAIPLIGKVPKAIQYVGKTLKGLDLAEDLYKAVPKKEMGGNIPGANSNMYARHGAPSNGPRGKKTMASAQDGLSAKADATRVAPRQPLDYEAIQHAKDIKDYETKLQHLVLRDEDQEQSPSWWNQRISGVSFTPEQRDYELQRRAENIVEDKYTPWQEKAKTAALEIGLSVVPELAGAKIFSAMKGAPELAKNIGQGTRTLGSEVGQVYKEAGKDIYDAVKYGKIGQTFEDIPRSLDEIRELQKIKSRIQNASSTDLIEWKKGRMLSRKAPDYSGTYDEFTNNIDEGARALGKEIDDEFGGVPMRLDQIKHGRANYIDEGYQKFDRLRPTNLQYRDRVTNPNIVLDDDLSGSYANVNEIMLGVNPERGTKDIPFQLGTVRNHELDHYVSYPTTEDYNAIKGFMNFEHSNPYYTGYDYNPSTSKAFNNVESLIYLDKKGTEMKARLGQLKDMLGLSGNEQMTMPQLRAALKVANNQEKYGMFNNMLDTNPANLLNSEIPIFRRVNDKKKMLQYMNDVTTNPVFTAHENGGVIKAEKGASVELTKLDQLTNFTNYNKPTRGGWLNKYQ